MPYLRRATIRLSSHFLSSTSRHTPARCLLTSATKQSQACLLQLQLTRGRRQAWVNAGYIRSYATEAERAAEQDSSEESASATHSDEDSSPVSSISETASEYAGKARDTAANVAESARSAAEDAVGAVTPDEPASSAQPTPVRAERTSTPPGSKQSPTNLYVGNLYFEVTPDTLKQEFERFGEVTSVKIVYDGRGLSKGFGYITFADPAHAQQAIQALDQQVFEGRRLAVQPALRQGIRPKGEDGTFGSPPSKTIFIGNLSYEMTDRDLNDLFREVKNVLDVRVAIDRRTGQPRGFAHADFLDVDSAQKAMDFLKSKEFYGRRLRCDFSASSRLSPGQS